MKRYLNDWAARRVERPLPVFASPAEFTAWRAERQANFHRALGIDKYLQAERTPLNIRVSGVIDDQAYRLEKLYYESLPGLYVAGHLYIPRELSSPAPGVLYVCGHHRNQKIQYQDHARRLAQLGFVTLIIDTVQNGEVFGEHHGTYSRGWFDWVSKGYTPAAIEVWNAIRGLDLLSARDEVDEQRLGVTGHSGGGSISWWTMCADDRVKAIAASSGTGHEASHLRERTLDRHCDCNFPNNPFGWSLIEQYALAAPRPVLIVAPDRDAVFQIDSVEDVFGRLKGLYASLGAEDRLKLFAFRSAHMYTPESRKQIFSWLLRHLAGQEVSPAVVEDIDGERLPDEQLLVYGGQPPADDRSLTVQEWFIPAARPVMPDSPQMLEQCRDNLVARLRQESFSAFPPAAGPCKPVIRQRTWNKPQTSWWFLFDYEAEAYWQLQGELHGAAPEPAEGSALRPLAVTLRMTGDERGKGAFALLQSASSSWLKARLDPRGTGDTAWGAEWHWHIRRAAALLGGTVASMRVWDTLRGIEALRNIPGVDSKRIVLSGSGEMAVVALYAALLDGNIAAVILDHPPDTLDAPDASRESPCFKEVINALRHADLPQTAACLWPAKLVFVGELPDGYRLTRDVYERMGGSVQVVSCAKEIHFSALI
ncbi:hypothetical protein PAESOLCIP111_04665 [Paenibacillus solanacearum]|uniref:Acetyl xylan esterase domain-containing protein n=1 Tax=Paenibacillus solanacearum TaxID=2048548 RepID=A0A916K533_9BACL|nr:acetylxylan esterase [Paenibacillus solanacearum]CAG7644323.1 hypothetical protein PAESOLCIP111_04665 [Paenibacillus solanacearum]